MTDANNAKRNANSTNDEPMTDDKLVVAEVEEGVIADSSPETTGPATTMTKRLSFLSRKYDIDGDGVLDDAELASKLILDNSYRCMPRVFFSPPPPPPRRSFRLTPRRFSHGWSRLLPSAKPRQERTWFPHKRQGLRPDAGAIIDAKEHVPDEEGHFRVSKMAALCSTWSSSLVLREHHTRAKKDVSFYSPAPTPRQAPRPRGRPRARQSRNELRLRHPRQGHKDERRPTRR